MRDAIGTALLLVALALTSFPIWAYGAEQFDAEQELGILLIPFGLITFLVAATTPDPRLTTVGGAFGNPEYAPNNPARKRADRLPGPGRHQLPRGGAMHRVPHGLLAGPGSMSPLRPGTPLSDVLPIARARARSSNVPHVRSGGTLV